MIDKKLDLTPSMTAKLLEEMDRIGFKTTTKINNIKTIHYV